MFEEEEWDMCKVQREEILFILGRNWNINQ